MCGFAGAIEPERSAEQWVPTLERMAATLHHRGPDDQGTWFDAAVGVGLAHRRLSIVDLSPEGHQPMLSSSGRYVIAFNGEIYNFEALRKALPDRAWRGHSDTEVMLAMIESYGLDSALERFVGMFAFALWDRHERELSLVRDRLGKKPLYYAWSGRRFLFGSELKALKAHPAFDATVDRNALALFLRHNYVPDPYSIYSGCYKLMPGETLRLSLADGLVPGRSVRKTYWSATEMAIAARERPFAGSDREAIDELDALLRDAVRMRMVADVPLGAFLSGGIDSSTIVALMQSQSRSPVKTFTIGFDEAEYDEAPHARRIAEHLGTKHTELYVRSEDARAVIPKLPAMFDEPFSDSSQIPTYLVSALARTQVTVSMSGDGGDELFAGYRRYVMARDLWGKAGRLPVGLRRAVAAALRAMPGPLLDMLSAPLASYFERYGRRGSPGDKLKKAADILDHRSFLSFYRDVMSHCKNPGEWVLGSREPPSVFAGLERYSGILDLTHLMTLADTVTYLPGDILTKVDRASMAVSLEARAPLLDHRVVEFAWRLPLNMKLRQGVDKWILRQVLARYLPPESMDRPKIGFGVPIDSWLRGPLRDWAESLLDSARIESEGFLRAAPIQRKWREHLSGERAWHYYLWDILMFQAWHEEQKG